MRQSGTSFMKEKDKKSPISGGPRNWDPNTPKSTLTRTPTGAEMRPINVDEMPNTDQKLGLLKKMIDTVPDSRKKKVRAIKNAIEKGRYEINKEKLAKILVDEAATDAVHRGKVGLRRWPPSD